MDNPDDGDRGQARWLSPKLQLLASSEASRGSLGDYEDGDEFGRAS